MPVTPAPCLITCNVGTISPATASVAVTLQFYMPPVAVQISGDAILDGRVASIVVPSDSQSAEIGILPGYYVVEGSGKGVQIGPFWIEVKPDTPAALLSELVLNVVPTEHSHSTLIQDIVAMRNAAAASAVSAAGSAARIDLGALDAAVGATVADRVQTGLDRSAAATSAAAAAASATQTGIDRTAISADRTQTGLDRVATAADRAQTGLDRTAVAADRAQTGIDRAAVAADRVQTGSDRSDASGSATAAGAAAATAVAAANDLTNRMVRYNVPLIADAVSLIVDATGAAIEVETANVQLGSILRPKLFIVPQVAGATTLLIGSDGVPIAGQAEAGAALGTFPVEDTVAGIGSVEVRRGNGAVTGRTIDRLWLRRSDAVYVPLTGGPAPVKLVSADLAAGAAVVRRNGVNGNVKWRTTPLGSGEVVHLLLVVGQSLAQGNTDAGVTERVPYWRDPVAERAWQFQAGDGIQRGPRVFQLIPTAGNKGTVVASTQLEKLEPLRGSQHGWYLNQAQTSCETAALALIGQHLHYREHVIGAVVGTGSTAIADFAPTTAHYQSAQAVITAAMARATAMNCALKVWLIWNQGEQDSEDGTAQATYEAAWIAIRDGLSAHTVSAGATFGGALIQQTLQRPGGVTSMATLAHANLITQGHAMGITPRPMFPGYSGGTHLLPATYLPLGAATGYEIARALAAPSGISGFLAGASKGAAASPAILANLWQTNDTSTPVVAAGQTVGRLAATGPSGSIVFVQSTSGLCPVLAAGGMIRFDGVDDYLEASTALRSLSQNTGAIVAFGKFKTPAAWPPATQQILWGFSTASSKIRALFGININGSLFLQSRRLDADAITSNSTATNTLVANTEYAFVAVIDYANGTTAIYLNGGGNLISIPALSSSGLTENTASLRMRLGAGVGSSPNLFFAGSLGRIGFANTVPTTEQRAAIFAELALDPRGTLAPHIATGDAVLTTSTQIDCRISGGNGAFALDTVTMPNDADGTYGVRVHTTAGEVAIASVTLTSANNLRITLATPVLITDAPRVELGLDGTEGATWENAAAARVNIRDTSAWPCPATGQIVSGWMISHKVTVTA